jgi:putative hydrolases of HD superfamily
VIPLTPAPVAATAPLALTRTMAGLSLLHVTAGAIAAPLASRTATRTVADCPTSSEIDSGETVSEAGCCAPLRAHASTEASATTTAAAPENRREWAGLDTLTLLAEPLTLPTPGAMQPTDLADILEFLRAAEALKTTLRRAWTSTGRQESVAEHTWRLCLMVMLLQPSLGEVDLARLLQMCIVHDLGEAIGGDVPAPEQARLGSSKAAGERRDLLTLVAELPPSLRATIIGLWDEYEAGATPEARLAKALDKLETILQHTQGQNPAGFDYRFNLAYGRQYTDGHPVLLALRALIDAVTEQRALAPDVPPQRGLPT